MDEDELQNELEQMENDINDETLDKQLNNVHIDETQEVPVQAKTTATTTATTTTQQPTTINNLPAVPTRQINSTQEQQQSVTNNSRNKKLTQAEEDELKSLEALMS